MKYYSAIKKNILPFAITWMGLEVIMLSEVSQTEMVKISHDLTYMWNLKANKQTNKTSKVSMQTHKENKPNKWLSEGRGIGGCRKNKWSD